MLSLSVVDVVRFYGCRRKRPREKHSNDHIVKALAPAAKRKAEEDWANSSVIKRVEEVQANLSAEFRSFLRL